MYVYIYIYIYMYNPRWPFHASKAPRVWAHLVPEDNSLRIRDSMICLQHCFLIKEFLSGLGSFFASSHTRSGSSGEKVGPAHVRGRCGQNLETA